MTDDELATIRQRDATHPERMPEHWAGPRDRRQLLALIDELAGRGLGWSATFTGEPRWSARDHDPDCWPDRCHPDCARFAA